MENVADGASSWPWFQLMNEAMEGRLAGTAPLLDPLTQDDEQHPDPAPRHRARSAPPPSSDYRPESFEDTEQNHRRSALSDGTLGGLEREWELFEGERAAVDRERAALQAERLWLDRERVALEQDRALVEQERAELRRERELLEQRALMLNSVGHMNTLL